MTCIPVKSLQKNKCSQNSVGVFFNAVITNRQRYSKFYCFTARLNLSETQSLEAGCIFWTDSGSVNTDKIKRITESPAAFSFTHNLSHIPHLHTSSSTNPLQGCCLVILRDSGSWRESGAVREQTEALLETLSFSINVTILLYVHGTTIKQTFRLC